MLPIIDLSSNSLKEEIQTAVENVGFFYITNTGISQDLINRIFNLSKEFFDLPLDKKMEISIDKSDNHRGYSGIGEENLEGIITNIIDNKESVDFGRNVLVPTHQLEGLNQYPNIPEFKETIDEYFNIIMDISIKILSQFDNIPLLKLDRPCAGLRLLHYPPGDNLGCGAHTDYGFLTLLLQDDKGGLQIQNMNGDWEDIKPIPGTLVVNIGDMISKLLGVTATLHRVKSTNNHRYSIPFFFDPNFDTDVNGVKVGEYLIEKFGSTYKYLK